MIEIDDSIAGLGVFRRLLPFVPENMRESFHAAAIQFSAGERRSSSAILKRATKELGWKKKIKILLIFAFWTNLVDAPWMVIAGILAAPFFLYSLIFG
jgi:hypothetical protein